MSLLTRTKRNLTALEVAITMLDTANKAKENCSRDAGTLWVAYTDYLDINGLRHTEVLNALSGMYIQA